MAENKVERVTDPSEYENSVLRIRFCSGTVTCSILVSCLCSFTLMMGISFYRYVCESFTNTLVLVLLLIVRLDNHKVLSLTATSSEVYCWVENVFLWSELFIFVVPTS